MKQLRERIEALYKAGLRGGEAEKMALMNYFVADAESRAEKTAKVAPHRRNTSGRVWQRALFVSDRSRRRGGWRRDKRAGRRPVPRWRRRSCGCNRCTP